MQSTLHTPLVSWQSSTQSHATESHVSMQSPGPHSFSQHPETQPLQLVAHVPQSTGQLIPFSPRAQMKSPQKPPVNGQSPEQLAVLSLAASQQPSPHVPDPPPQSVAHEHGVSPPAAPQQPSPQLPASVQSSGHEHAVSVALQHPSPQPEPDAQSAAQLHGVSPPGTSQQPSPHDPTQSLGQVQRDSPSSHTPLPQPATLQSVAQVVVSSPQHWPSPQVGAPQSVAQVHDVSPTAQVPSPQPAPPLSGALPVKPHPTTTAHARTTTAFTRASCRRRHARSRCERRSRSRVGADTLSERSVIPTPR